MNNYHNIIRHTRENDCAEIDCVQQHDFILLHFARSNKSLAPKLEKLQQKLEFLRDAARDSDGINFAGGQGVYESPDSQNNALSLYTLTRMVEVVKALRGLDHDITRVGFIEMDDIIRLLKIDI